MSNRRLAALLAMATQDESPEEAEIARAKLAAIRQRDEADEEWMKAWADQREHDRIAEALARQRQDAEIAQLVKRWERGTFSGMKFGVSATGAGIVP